MKKLISFLLAAALMLLLGLTAYAAEPDSFVVDTAGILTQQELSNLNEEAAFYSDAHDFGIYILVVEDYIDLPWSGGIEAVTKRLYQDLDYGIGSSRSGILLLLSMKERNYALHVYGDVYEAFTDHGHDYLTKEFLNDLADDSWYDGFSDYITTSAYMLEQAENGEPVGENPPHARTFGIIACVLLGFLTALIVTSVLKAQLTSVSQKAEAGDFKAGEGLQLSVRTDRYTHTTRTRVYDPPKESNDRSSSGSSTSSGNF